MAKLIINGENREFELLPRTLAELLCQLNVNEATVVAEIDGSIIARGTFCSTPLKDGQVIELVRFVGGG